MPSLRDTLYSQSESRFYVDDEEASRGSHAAGMICHHECRLVQSVVTEEPFQVHQLKQPKPPAYNHES